MPTATALIEAPLISGLDMRPADDPIGPPPPEVESISMHFDNADSCLTQTVSITTTTAPGSVSADVQNWIQATAMKLMQDRVFRTWATTVSTTGTINLWPTTVTTASTAGWYEDRCTSGANAVWRLDSWQNSNHAKLRWAPERVSETPEQIAERAAQAEIARQARIIEEAKRKVFLDTAKSRARRLLVSMLTPAQQVQLDEKNYFDLTVHSKDGSQKVYRIEHGYQGNVKLLDANGQPIKRYCIHADSRLPYEDQMLAQKLLLESNETDFLRIANMTHLRAA